MFYRVTFVLFESFLNRLWNLEIASGVLLLATKQKNENEILSLYAQTGLQKLNMLKS